MHAMGAHLWYDEGIEPGSEWSESLTRAINNAAAILFFVSPRSIRSKHCRDEISYAKDNNVPITCIHLEATQLTDGLRLSLGASQAIMKHELGETLYEQKLRQVLTLEAAAVVPSAPGVSEGRTRRWRLFAALAVTLIALAALSYLKWSETAGAAGASAGRKTIAVLPFVNLSNDPENEFFADGLTDTLIYQLSKLEALRVTARKSAFAFKGSAEDVPAIADRLGVSTVLDGTIQRNGDQIRVFAQLTDVASNDNIWSDQFDMQVQNTLSVQDEIATSVTGALKLKMLGEAADRLTAHATENLAAYDYYLRGVQFYEQFDFESLERSAELLGRAIDLDPDFSIAYLALVRNLTTQHVAGKIDLGEMMRRSSLSWLGSGLLL